MAHLRYQSMSPITKFPTNLRNTPSIPRMCVNTFSTHSHKHANTCKQKKCLSSTIIISHTLENVNFNVDHHALNELNSNYKRALGRLESNRHLTKFLSCSNNNNL